MSVHERKGGFGSGTYSLLLLCLRQCRGCPTNDDGIHRIRAAGEDKEGHVTGGHIESRSGNDEASNGRGQASGDVPRPLVQSSRAPAKEDTRSAGKDEGRAGQYQSDGAVEAECVDDAASFM